MVESRPIERHRRRERNLLRQYRTLLEAQRAAIEGGDIDRIEEILRGERVILRDLEALAAVILPGVGRQDPDDNRAELLDTVRELQRRNRMLLAERSAEYARRIRELRIPPQRRTVYADRGATGGMVDVRT
ncbi:MAG: hypothetical protein ACOC2V_01875 [Alkalispirochaeta sp.]